MEIDASILQTDEEISRKNSTSTVSSILTTSLIDKHDYVMLNNEKFIVVG